MLPQKKRFVFVTGLVVWINVHIPIFAEQFLQGNVPINHQWSKWLCPKTAKYTIVKWVLPWINLQWLDIKYLPLRRIKQSGMIKLAANIPNTAWVTKDQLNPKMILASMLEYPRMSSSYESVNFEHTHPVSFRE